jgi:hypothetical protein
MLDRRSLRHEKGQVVVAFVLLLAGLLAIAGLVVDVGNAYRVHRALQASADAAALAGGQSLPNAAAAVSVARLYGATTAGRNKLKNITSVESITTRCLTSVPGCAPVNAVAVEESASVPTVFLRLVGLDAFHMKARATACSPCGVRPLDIVMVLDRTGSMCQDSHGNTDSACTDLNNAKNGIRSFLAMMDQSSQWVGLTVFPPATGTSTSAKCATPVSGNYNTSSNPYTLVPLAKDYKTTTGAPNSASNLVSTLSCLKGGGTTAYGNAIDAAQAELTLNGRSGVQDVIVFMSDGAANTGPTYYSSTSDYRIRPCKQGVTSAGLAKTGTHKTIVYSIAYALEDDTGGCMNSVPNPDKAESPTITSDTALRNIASTGNFYNKPTSGDLTNIYTQIAVDIGQGTSGLIDDATP